MTFADMEEQGIHLEMACNNLDNIIGDIGTLKVEISDLLDDTDHDLRPGSRFRKLVRVKALIHSVGIDSYSALRSVKSALAYQQASLPQPED